MDIQKRVVIDFAMSEPVVSRFTVAESCRVQVTKQILLVHLRLSTPSRGRFQAEDCLDVDLFLNLSKWPAFMLKTGTR